MCLKSFVYQREVYIACFSIAIEGRYRVALCDFLSFQELMSVFFSVIKMLSALYWVLIDLYASVMLALREME